MTGQQFLATGNEGSKLNNLDRFYINGSWVEPLSGGSLEIVNPATEESFAKIPLGSAADVDAAVDAASAAFESFSTTTRDERIALLESIIAEYRPRLDEIAGVVSKEMGAPIGLARAAQAPAALAHLMVTLQALKSFKFEERLGNSLVVLEPAGVCGMITPWNWPLNQISCKVAAALAAGCTMVLKPSEIAPLNAVLFTEVMDAAGTPPGVFNLVHGEGPVVGASISSHPKVDVVSFTGSTRAGVDVARRAALSVKRVCQELGGKSANIILEDCDFDKVVARDTLNMCSNTGQSCNAPTRMLVPHSRMEEAAEIASEATKKVRVGEPGSRDTTMGPLSSEVQFNKVQRLIEKGIEEGAQLACGGLGRPDGLNVGFFVKPTVFSHVTNDMSIAREEIFGPVLSLIGYEDENDAVRIANDTDYGLSGYVSSADTARASAIARRIRSGNVHINGSSFDAGAPFGGYKQSGNGREFGRYGMEEFLEPKAIIG